MGEAEFETTAGAEVPEGIEGEHEAKGSTHDVSTQATHRHTGIAVAVSGMGVGVGDPRVVRRFGGF